ncbi:hypothetical protein FXB41_22035 [Bradyrhizobium canariense]|nr:hypothetical protein [Bradyrhizobium canariense]
MEANMSTRAICGALIIYGSMAVCAFPTVSLAQSTETGVSAQSGAGASPPEKAAPNTNTNPTKHRYWRHRGGKHPHFGSRRVRA